MSETPRARPDAVTRPVDDRIAIIEESPIDAQYIVVADSESRAKSYATRRYMRIHEGEGSWRIDLANIGKDIWRVWLQPSALQEEAE